MTIGEKRSYLSIHCKGRICAECPLYTFGKIHKDFRDMSEQELDRYLRLIGKDPNEEYHEETIGVDELINDAIKPDYYNDTKIAPIDVIEDWDLDFCLGSALKYIKRAGKKDNNPSVQDLRKVIWYVKRRIKELEGVNDRDKIRNME